MPYLAFLSHRQADTGDRAAAFHEEMLQRFRYHTWFDQKKDDLTRKKMKEGISESEYFILFVSPSYVESAFCRMEVKYALQVNKKIILLYEPSDDIEKVYVKDIDKDFLAPLLKALRENDKAKVFESKDEVSVLSFFHERIPFGRRIGSQKREKMYQTLFDITRLQYTPVSINASAFRDGEIFIVAHPANGEDQSTLIEVQLRKLGVSAHFIDHGLPIFSNIFKDCNYLRAIVVFLTNGVLSQPHIDCAVKAAQELGKKLVFAYEDDSRRQGYWKFENNNESLVSKFANKSDCLAFAKETRREENLKLFADKLAHRCGCATLVDLPLQFDRNEVLNRKRIEFEPGTRDWILDELVTKTQSNHAAFLLSGAGMGKSCIMAELTSRYSPTFNQEVQGFLHEDERLSVAAYHFFDWSDINAKYVELALKSIARQLCTSIPGFRHCLAKSREELENQIKTEGQNMESLFKLLIINPCKTLVKHTVPRKFTILIDALDECDDPKGFSAAISCLWGEAPSFVSLIVSSRPQTFVQYNFKGYNPLLLEPTQEQNQEDLRVFLKKRLKDRWGVSNDNIDEICHVIIIKSGGVFLWLAFQEKHLRDLAETNELTINAIQNLPDGIQTTYRRYFQRLFENLKKFREGNEKKAYQSAVVIGLVLPRSPITELIWKECLGFTDSTLADREAYSEFKSIASLFSVNPFT